MLKSIRRWLFGSSRSQPLITAQAQRAAARQAYLDAWTRGDTRSMHHAELRLKRATLAELQAGRVAA